MAKSENHIFWYFVMCTFISRCQNCWKNGAKRRFWRIISLNCLISNIPLFHYLYCRFWHVYSENQLNRDHRDCIGYKYTIIVMLQVHFYVISAAFVICKIVSHVSYKCSFFCVFMFQTMQPATPPLLYGKHGALLWGLRASWRDQWTSECA